MAGAVSGAPYRTASIADLERPDGWSPIRRHFDMQSFGINAWTAHEAGAGIIPDHDEQPSGHEELYLVTAGAATFTVAGERVDVPAGSAIFVADPAVARGAIAAEPETTVVAVGGAPGEVYRPRAWETNADVFALLDEGRNDEARRLLLDALERYDDRATLLYNLACTEAQLGDTDAALEHLEAALSGRPSLAESARADGDLEPIRGDPRYASIVGA
jgi:tetratricopeptide (TPR) repeat protein